MNYPPYKPVEGKTYSLFAGTDSSDDFYREMEDLLDSCLNRMQSPEQLLGFIQRASTRNGFRRKQGSAEYLEFLNHLKQLVVPHLSVYTRNVEKHLNGLSPLSFWGKTLHTSEWQYHLYMLEITLVNRLNRNSFSQSAYRIALLPHCLRDLSGNCKASKTALEYECRNCSRDCFIGQTSMLLRKYNVQPYLWMSASLKSLLKSTAKSYKTVGVLGIACIPELVAGMRKCMKAGLPVIGLPLNANRCIRWMGAFYENSVNLEELERLLD